MPCSGGLGLAIPLSSGSTSHRERLIRAARVSHLPGGLGQVEGRIVVLLWTTLSRRRRTWHAARATSVMSVSAAHTRTLTPSGGRRMERMGPVLAM
jgi:hypothetical protein